MVGGSKPKGINRSSQGQAEKGEKKNGKKQLLAEFCGENKDLWSVREMRK